MRFLKKRNNFEVLAIDGIQASVAVAIPIILYNAINNSEFAVYSIVLAVYSILSGLQGALYLGGMKLEVLSLNRTELSHRLSSIIILSFILGILGSVILIAYDIDLTLIALMLPFTFFTLLTEVLFVYFTANYSKRILILVKPVRSILIALLALMIVINLNHFMLISILMNALFVVFLLLKIPFEFKLERFYTNSIGSRRFTPIFMSLSIPQLPVLISGMYLGVESTNALKGFQLLVSMFIKIQASLNNLYVPRIQLTDQFKKLLMSYISILMPVSLLLGIFIYCMIFYEVVDLFTMLKNYKIEALILFVLVLLGGFASLFAWKMLGEVPNNLLKIQVGLLAIWGVIFVLNGLELFTLLTILIVFNPIINIGAGFYGKLFGYGK